MAERSLKLTCVEGVNRQLEAMRPNQCYDARNVWERNGKVVERPGYVGLVAHPGGVGVSVTDPAGYFLIRHDSTGYHDSVAGSLDLSGLQVGEDWFVGLPLDVTRLIVRLSSTNSSSATFSASFWDGLGWRFLLVTEYSPTHLRDASPFFVFAAPRDWISNSVNGHSARYIRFTIMESALDASTVATLPSIASPWLVVPTVASGVFGLSADEVGAGVRFSVDLKSAASIPPVGVYSVRASLLRPEELCTTMSVAADYTAAGRAVFAAVSTSNEIFTAFNHHVVRTSVAPGAESVAEAAVESGDWAVGPGAPYDKTNLAQLSAFPKASIITFFQNRLWTTDIEGEPGVIRWGAPAPYHKVWPELAFERVDTTPTALRGLGENMVAYTQDSIHLAILDEIDAFGIPRYKFMRNVAGRGCVAPNSIQEINGRHIFLSEDGLYAYNGTANVEKVTLDKKTGADRLEDVFSRVTSSSRHLASSAHWRQQRVYLLSVPIGGSDTNGLTIVWDYEKDRFWLWDDISAQSWMVINSSSTDEVVYFADEVGRIFQLTAGADDHGAAIDSWFVTAPIGMDDSMHRGLTEVKVLAPNSVGSLDFEVWANGIAGQAGTGTLDFSDYREAKYGTAIYGTSKYVGQNVRFRHHHFREDGSYFQVKVKKGTGAQVGALALSRLDVRLLDKYQDSR